MTIQRHQVSFADFITDPTASCLYKWPMKKDASHRTFVTACSLAFSILTASLGYWACKIYSTVKDRKIVTLALSDKAVPKKINNMAVQRLGGMLVPTYSKASFLPSLADWISHPIDSSLAALPKKENASKRRSLIIVSVAFSVLTLSLGYWVAKLLSLKEELSFNTTRTKDMNAITTLADEAFAPKPKIDPIKAFSQELSTIFKTKGRQSLKKHFPLELQEKIRCLETLSEEELLDTMDKVEKIVESPVFGGDSKNAFGPDQYLAEGLWFESLIIKYILTTPPHRDWETYAILPIHEAVFKKLYPFYIYADSETKDVLCFGHHLPENIAGDLRTLILGKKISLDKSIDTINQLKAWIDENIPKLSTRPDPEMDYVTSSLDKALELLKIQQTVYGT